MIYTVTFNPAIDYVMRMDKMETGGVNRSAAEEFYIGGKGINVSAVLKELGVESVALGFTAGFTGAAIEQGLAAQGIRSDFVRLEKGISRINVKIKCGKETELNGQGPDIPQSAVEELFRKLDKLSDGDTLVLAGSIPHSMPSDIYERILARLYGRDIRFVVDTSGELLLKSLKYKPFLIKPNNCELEEIFGSKAEGLEDITVYAGRLREMGARNVLVSLAGDGAVLLDELGRIHRCTACKGRVKNSVGAGDSMVAGFIAGFRQGDFGSALRLGTAAGGATAFSDGLAKREMIFELLSQLGEKI